MSKDFCRHMIKIFSILLPEVVKSLLNKYSPCKMLQLYFLKLLLKRIFSNWSQHSISWPAIIATLPDSFAVSIFRTWGRGVLNKCLCGEAPPRGPTPYPLIHHFSQKRHFIRIPSIDKWYSFHIPCLGLCIPFNCCKLTLLNRSQSQK